MEQRLLELFIKLMKESGIYTGEISEEEKQDWREAIHKELIKFTK